MTKREALAKEWNAVVEDVTDQGGNIYTIGNMEFLVLTDEEADELYYKKELDVLKKSICALQEEINKLKKNS